MRTPKKKVKYPENLQLKLKIKESGRSLTWYQKKIGVSYTWISRVIAGHDKGEDTVNKINELLN